VSIELQVQDIVLGLLRRLTFEWVLLGQHEVYAAAHTPDISLGAEVVLLQDQLRG